MTHTAKAERTRRHILDTALNLFITKGYEETTMRDIAATAETSLGLTYRYFSKKETLVLELYRQMAAETAQYIEALPQATLAERFHQVMASRLRAAEPYRDTLGALFSTTLNPKSEAGLLGEEAAEMRSTALDAFQVLVENSSNAPSESQHEGLATLLYSLHFGIILFWLHDQTPMQRATANLLDFVRDMLNQLRFILRLPFAGNMLNRLAAIIADVFIPAVKK